jgi:hypothetical protein
MTLPSARVSPKVSVVIPARNEEACLGTCLRSLVAQAEVSFEIIVVDDASVDRTREVAESFAGVEVVSAEPLLPGWSGKNNALRVGFEHARGEWLLFTDADTVHLPGSLARAVAEAEEHAVALLSYSPEQQVGSFWEKAVMPVIFAELAACYRPSAVSDPRSASAAANGQYLLIFRPAYEALGGQAAVASSLLEDVALARRLKSSGGKVRFRYGADAVRTRMYRSFAHLSEGWTKNLALLFPRTVQLAAGRALEFAVIAGGAGGAIVEAWRAHPAGAVLFALIGGGFYARFFRRIRKAHFARDANVLAILGLPLFCYLLLRSRFRHKRGDVDWKGRRYGSSLERPTGNGRTIRIAGAIR